MHQAAFPRCLSPSLQSDRPSTHLLMLNFTRITAPPFPPMPPTPPQSSSACLAPEAISPALGGDDDHSSLRLTSPACVPPLLPYTLQCFPPLFASMLASLTQVLFFLLWHRLPPSSATQTPCLRPYLGFWVYSLVCPGSIDGVFDFTPGTCVWIHGLEERKFPVAPAPLSGHVGNLLSKAKQGFCPPEDKLIWRPPLEP